MDWNLRGTGKTARISSGKTIGNQINGKEESIQRLQASSARFYQRPDIAAFSFDNLRFLGRLAVH